MTEKEYWYWLLNLEQVGPAALKLLFRRFKTPEAIFQASEREISDIYEINGRAVSSIINSRQPDKIRESYANLAKKDIYLVTRTEEAYPEKLRQIERAPYGIYVKGRLPEPSVPSVAIVGARSCSGYGREAAQYFAKELSLAGVQIISGLARGIDACAHRGSLDGGAPAFAVLGCGIDICYPRENLELYLQLQRTGGIFSEYAPGCSPRPGYFPMRNRIISGLSDGVLVVEAREKSGSLITADFALEQGKPVFAVPGRIDDVLSRGTDNLIKMGAELVTEPADILEHYQIRNPRILTPSKKNNNLLETKEEIVYASLGLMPKHMDEIKEETCFTVPEVMEELVSLETKGLVIQTAPNYYAAVKL